MGKNCELCGLSGWIYCESDHANLCWSCDAKVHGANFLVAKHERCLLCSSCFDLTPWKATGSQLGRTLSFCHGCCSSPSSSCSSSSSTKALAPPPEEVKFEAGGGGLAIISDNKMDTTNGCFKTDREVDKEGEGENHILPLNPASSTLPPETTSSSSTEEEEEPSSRKRVAQLPCERSQKRMRDTVTIKYYYSFI